MLISELIKQLQRQLKNNGDLEVIVWGRNEEDYPRCINIVTCEQHVLSGSITPDNFSWYVILSLN